MRRWALRSMLVIGLLTLLVALALGALLAWGVSEGVPAGSALVIDGEHFELDVLRTRPAEHWLLVALVLLVVALALVVVLPLALGLALLIPLLTAGLTAAATLLALALVASPLILLVWWLLRRTPARATGGATTMPP